MYCTRCGKKIDYDAFVCNECVKQEQEAFAEVKTEAAEPVVEATVEPAVEEPVATATAEPVQEPVNPQPTYTAPNNQQYYYSNPNTGYQNAAYVPYQPTPVQPAISGNPRMNGFGKSLASTILGGIAYFFSVIALELSVSGIEDLAASAIVILLASLGMAIPALVMGIKSIKLFVNAPKQGLPRPIATLILGINGVACAGFYFFFALLTFVIASSY